MEHDREVAPRVAPSPENYEKTPDLDVVIVLPCYNEGLDVLRTLGSIARQVTDKKIRHSAVVVINNRPDAPEAAQQANMQSYAVVQMLRHGYPVDVGDQELNECIKIIQDKKLRIDIIDAFSPEHAHPQSNVGRARHVGKQYAQSLPRHTPHIIGTDAGDSIMNPRVVEAVYRAFDQGYADALAIPTYADEDQLRDPESRRANERWMLHSKVSQTFISLEQSVRDMKRSGDFSIREARDPLIEQAFATMGGAGMAISAAFVPKVNYDPALSTAEDTEIQFSIGDAGGRVENLRHLFPQAYILTQPRISERTTAGFGTTIKRFESAAGAFGDIKVMSPKALVKSRAFLSLVGVIPEGPQATKTFERICRRFKMPEEKVQELTALYDTWKGARASTREHYQVINATNKYFKESEGESSVNDVIVALEAQNEKLSGEFDRLVRTFLRPLPGPGILSWAVFQREMLRVFSACIQAESAPPSDDVVSTLRALTACAYKDYLASALETMDIAVSAFVEKRPPKDETGKPTRFLKRRTSKPDGARFNTAAMTPEERQATVGVLDSVFHATCNNLFGEFQDIEGARLPANQAALLAMMEKVNDGGIADAWKRFTKVAGGEWEKLATSPV